MNASNNMNQNMALLENLGQVNSPHAVLPGLLISGRAFETVEQFLKEQRVTHILQVGLELRATHPDKFSYLNIPIHDVEGEDIVVHLQEAFGFIDDGLSQGGCVLVHCAAGVSRSASTCIAYLMWKQQLEFVEAAEKVFTARPFISPNPGFVLQLQLWERSGMDFAAWGGWSRAKFLEALEDCGGLQACQFENVMRDAGRPIDGRVGASAAPLVMIPSKVTPVRRPMPVSLSSRLCCIS